MRLGEGLVESEDTESIGGLVNGVSVAKLFWTAYTDLMSCT